MGRVFYMLFNDRQNKVDLNVFGLSPSTNLLGTEDLRSSFRNTFDPVPFPFLEPKRN